MKTITIISSIFFLAMYSVQSQPKYTKSTLNQSGYIIRNLNGYKESGSKLEDRDTFKNPQRYKNAVVIKPEAKGEGIFPVLPEGINENVLVAEGNYKAQFKSSKKSKGVSGQPIPYNNTDPLDIPQNNTSSKLEEKE